MTGARVDVAPAEDVAPAGPGPARGVAPRAAVRRPSASRVVGAALLVGVAATPLLLGSFASFVGGRIAVIAIIGLSVTVVTGYTGQLSLMPWTFAGTGVFVAAHAMTAWGWPFWFAALLAAAATVPLSVVVGLVAARLRGVHFAIATLTFATAAGATLFSWDAFTGGQRGLSVVRPTVFGVSLAGDRAFYVLCLAAVLLVTWMVLGLQQSRIGRAMAAVRENEIEAQAIGINVVKTKLVAFVLSGIVAGIGGVFQAMLLQHVTRTPYQTPFVETLGVTLVILVVVGGRRSAWGPLLGASVIYLQQEVFRTALFLQFFVAAIAALLFLFVVLQAPGGLVEIGRHELARAREHPRRHVPRLVATVVINVGILVAIVRYAS